MQTITAEQLKQILGDHAQWLRDSTTGKRANLSRANLAGANLYMADLAGADLAGANLSRADLSMADLAGADLAGANLSRADLSRANLAGANLSRADLSRANLSRANLAGANLYMADLAGANLAGANLYMADLSRANLSRANLAGANLSRANNIPALAIAQHTTCPPRGSIIGWKKCRDGLVVNLKVLDESRRSSALGRKCRADRVEVLGVYRSRAEQAEDGLVALSMKDGRTQYKAGETVTCDTWGEDRFIECAGGIHFFITREEAECFEL